MGRKIAVLKKLIEGDPKSSWMKVMSDGSGQHYKVYTIDDNGMAIGRFDVWVDVNNYRGVSIKMKGISKFAIGAMKLLFESRVKEIPEFSSYLVVDTYEGNTCYFQGQWGRHKIPVLRIRTLKWW